MTASPDSFTRAIPSIHQVNPAFSGGGSTLCGPTSAADVITYLWRNGYSNFHADKQAELVNELAKIMWTGSYGVNGSTFIFGLSHYIENKGYKATFELSGITIAGDGVAKIDPPDLEKAKLDVSRGKFVFLELGFVELTPDGYELRGGHWVVLSGYDKTSLVLNDPAYGSIYTSRVQYLTKTNFTFQGHNISTDKFLGIVDTPRKYLPVIVATVTMDIKLTI
jgi:hypothetical protein